MVKIMVRTSMGSWCIGHGPCSGGGVANQLQTRDMVELTLSMCAFWSGCLGITLELQREFQISSTI
jgi:hypothetical protein